MDRVAAKPLKVLVVDDTATNRQILQVFLRKLGYDVVFAVDGAQAVEQFAAAQPDLVLMDVMMPVMDGFEATRRIRQLCGSHWVPIVFLSALDKEENLVAGLDAGGDDYLFKPVSFTVLDAKLRSLTRTLRMQRVLEDTRRRLQAISANMLDGLIITDETAVIQSVNPATAATFGYAPEALIGRHVSTLLPAQQSDGAAVAIPGVGRRELHGVRADGTVFPLEAGITEIDFDGARMFISLVRDISERKAAEDLLRENAASLQRYRDQQEAENVLAHDVMLRQMVREGGNDARVHQWLAPAANFSGDIVVAATSPNGCLYAMLADATGHGLSAAISALPVLSVFHGTVKRGLPLGTIVGEINRHLRATLPGGRFVAATLLCFDGRSQRAEAWVGGMPEMLHLGADGRPLRTLASNQLPLGVVEGDAEMAVTEAFHCEPGSQFVMYSDGLVEAADAAGEAFGVERLLDALAAVPAAGRLDAVRSALTRHLGGARPHDDVSMMLLDCR
ncbi:MAG: SpoIIE family protein phosphatase [Rhodocyclaceae bacterium]|nr:SpoIIE family protein phosphatase [Rhodocyclaceae bacterium]